MCDYKQLYEPVVKNDSRTGVAIGQALGGKVGQFIEDEGRHNTQNPGRGLTKVAESAALWYLGALAGGAGAAGSAAGNTTSTAGTAATDVAESGGSLALGAAGNAVPYAAQTAGQQAASLAAQQAMAQYAGAVEPEATTSFTTPGAGGLLGSAKNAVANTAYENLVPGVGTQQADMLAQQTADFGPYGLGKTMQAASTANGLTPAQQYGGQYGGGLLSKFGGGPTTAGSNTSRLAMNMGAKMLQPQQPQQPPPPPARQQQSGPPPSSPYGPVGQSPYPMAPSPSMLTEAEKQRLRMMGYQI